MHDEAVPVNGAAGHYRVLAEVTAAVTESLEVDAAMTRLADVVVPRLADWCTVHLVEDDGSIRTVAISHVDPERVRLAHEIDRRYGPAHGDGSSIRRVLRSGEAEYHPNVDAAALRRAARDDEHLALLEAAGFGSAVLTPLRRRERVLGVLTLVADAPRQLDEGIVDLAGEVARRAAVGVENARLYEASERAQREAAENNRTLEHLLRLAPTLGTAADEHAAATALATGAREAFRGTSASVWRFVGDEIELVARVPEQAHLQPGYRLPLSDFPGFKAEVSVARPSFVPDLSAQYPSLEETARTIDVGSLVRLPLVGSDGPEGFVIVAWKEPRAELTPALMALGQRFADLAALAIEEVRHRRSEQLRRLLHLQLEASLMPAPRIEPTRLRVFSRYRAGEQRMMLGGDFLDASHLPDGRVLAMIGDVSGHGPIAAALAASLRAAWRALTRAGVAQASLLAALHELVLDERDDVEMFATLCSVELDPHDAACHVVSAGHPPPVLLGDGAPRLLAGSPAPPLGVAAGAFGAPLTVPLPERWALLLYTDGLIEGRARPGASERFGSDRLLRWLAERVGDGRLEPGTLDALLRDIDAANGEHGDDDVAALALVPP